MMQANQIGDMCRKREGFSQTFGWIGWKGEGYEIQVKSDKSIIGGSFADGDTIGGHCDGTGAKHGL